MRRVGYTLYTLVGLLALFLAAAGVWPDVAQGQAKAKDTIVLSKGKGPLGGVKLDHKKHAELAGVQCETCHHASKPAVPLKSPQQVCSDCHTMPAKAPIKTNYQAAFHKPTGQTGLCIDCHKQSNRKGSKAPVRCMDCHKKENVAGK